MTELAPRPARITRVVRESPDTFTLEIDAGDRARFAPGQFNMLYVFGVGEVPISVSGDPARSAILVHTTREVGSVTSAMRRLRRGASVGVRGPYGVGWPLAAAAGHDVVLVAGGIGLAPLRPALHAIAARRQAYGKVVLLYGTRSPEDVLFRRELAAWRTRADVHVAVTVDRGTRAWPGHVGVVTALVPRAPFDPARTVALVCGPEIMMRFAAEALARRGVAEDRIHLSMERNMKCAIGHCGRCQLGPSFVCKDGPVLPYGRLHTLLGVREL